MIHAQQPPPPSEQHSTKKKKLQHTKPTTHKKKLKNVRNSPTSRYGYQLLLKKCAELPNVELWLTTPVQLFRRYALRVDFEDTIRVHLFILQQTPRRCDTHTGFRDRGCIITITPVCSTRYCCSLRTYLVDARYSVSRARTPGLLHARGKHLSSPPLAPLNRGEG